MKHLYTSYCLSLGLSLMLTACGDPSQFNELMTGEPIYADEKAEMTTTPDTESNPKNVTYAGEETNTSTVAEVADETSASTSESTTAKTDTAQNTGSSPAPKLFSDCDDSPEQGIVANLYQLPADTNRLPNFSAESSLRTVCLAQLNIKDRQFTEGFPGVEDLYEWFGLDMHFQVNVPKNGYYDFTMLSDDGAILWIDDKKIIDNDGLHAVTEKTAKVYLTAGSHSFHVAYYQGPRWRIALELYWKVPGTSSKVYIPASAISRPE